MVRPPRPHLTRGCRGHGALSPRRELWGAELGFPPPEPCPLGARGSPAARPRLPRVECGLSSRVLAATPCPNPAGQHTASTPSVSLAQARFRGVGSRAGGRGSAASPGHSSAREHLTVPTVLAQSLRGEPWASWLCGKRFTRERPVSTAPTGPVRGDLVPTRAPARDSVCAP